jgi:hypothetical protein
LGQKGSVYGYQEQHTPFRLAMKISREPDCHPGTRDPGADLDCTLHADQKSIPSLLISNDDHCTDRLSLCSFAPACQSASFLLVSVPPCGVDKLFF